MGLSAITSCTPPGLPAAIAPASTAAVGSIPAAESTVVVGIDGMVNGFNPHAIADYSPADNAVAALVLPSVSTVAADGAVQLNKDLVRSARITSTDPFTVTYTLDRNAAWSDGTPITAEDFSYLHDQMLIQPGTVDPAGYRLITSIRSRDAGKTVEVEFSKPVPDWKSLFSPLLPAHILKDSPGGWAEGLAAGIPVSGNRYKMDGYDTVTGEITLVRNDKYWAAQPGPSTAVLRIGTSTAMLDALGRGEIQAVFLQPDAATGRSLELKVPATRRKQVALPGTVQLVFDTASGPTAQLQVRKAIAAGLDVRAVRSALDGANDTGSAAAGSMVSLDDTSAAPILSNDAAAAQADLTVAGYHRESLYMSKAGQVLRLTMVYPSGDQRFAAAARLIQKQLSAIGIEVDLIRDSPRVTITGRLAAGTADLGLVMVPRGTSDGLAAASSFGCASTPQKSSTTPAPPRTGNLSGLCATSVQGLLATAETGGGGTGLDEALWSELPVLPLSRPVAIFATSTRLAGVVGGAGPGWTYSGPLVGLAEWPVK